MTDSRFAIPIERLEASAHVPDAQQVVLHAVPKPPVEAPVVVPADGGGHDGDGD